MADAKRIQNLAASIKTLEPILVDVIQNIDDLTSETFQDAQKRALGRYACKSKANKAGSAVADLFASLIAACDLCADLDEDEPLLDFDSSDIDGTGEGDDGVVRF